MRAPRPLAVLVDPLGAVPGAVEARAFVAPLLLAMVLSAAASAAIATRLDTSRLVLPRLEAAGELQKASEREISEQIEQAQRVAIVAGVAKGLLGVPMLALLAAAGLWFMSWLVGGRAGFAECFTVICLALLPLAVGQGVTLAAALNQTVIAPKAVKALVPSSLDVVLDRPASASVFREPERARDGARPPDRRDAEASPLRKPAADDARPARDAVKDSRATKDAAPDASPASKHVATPDAATAPAPGAPLAWKASARESLLGLVDFFHLWSALVLGLGFAAATKRARWQAVPLGVALYFLVIAAVTIGLPGLAANAGGPG